MQLATTRSLILPRKVEGAQRFLLSGAYRAEDGTLRPYDFSLDSVAYGYDVRVAAAVRDARDEWCVIGPTSHAIDASFQFRDRQVRDGLTRELPYTPWNACTGDGLLVACLSIRASDVVESVYGGPAPFSRYAERLVGTLPTRRQVFLRLE